MRVEPEAVEVISEAAGLRGPSREVFRLECDGLEAKEIAAATGRSLAWVYKWRTRTAEQLATAQQGYATLREWYEDLLASMRGPRSSPPTPEFYTTPGQWGERVALNAGSPVTVDSLLERAGHRRPHVGESLNACAKPRGRKRTKP